MSISTDRAHGEDGGHRAPAVARRSSKRAERRDRGFALRRALLLADMTGLWLALALALVVGGNRAEPQLESLLIVPTLPFWALLFRAYGLYRRPVLRFEPTHLDDMTPLFHALLIGTLGLWLFTRVTPVAQLSLVEVVVFGGVALPLIAGLRLVLRAANLRHSGPERVFVLAPAADVELLRRKLKDHPEYEMALVGAAVGDSDAAPPALPLNTGAALEEVEALVVSGQIDHVLARLDADYLPQAQVAGLMALCQREGVRFGYFPRVRNLLFPGTEVNQIEGVGILTHDPPVLSRTASALKRGLDVVVSGLALALFALPMALIAAAIKLTSKGPVFYKQQRVGQDGYMFELVKFRTMVENAEELTLGLMAHSADPNWLDLEEDPRVTSVGRFLRHTSLDELPQLWNVLKGEMSLVGPRPLSRRDDVNVRGWQRHRLDLIPGITGYWQILGRNNIPFEEMLEIDYAYVASWSLWYDVKILLRTLPVVLLRRGVN